MVSSILETVIAASTLQGDIAKEAVVYTALSTNAVLGIAYIDKDYVVSIRTIRVRSVYRAQNGNLVVQGFCQHRQAIRQFNMTRVALAEIQGQ